MRDIAVVWRKEIKELLATHGSPKSWFLRVAMFVAMFGVYLPLKQREFWVEGFAPALFYPFIPVIIANWVVADSFAGERERKTLETLLSTRLPDYAIFFGKVLSALAYAWVFTAVSLLVSLVALNMSAPPGEVFLYPLFVFVSVLVGSILTGLLIVEIGVFISLRAKTVRAAQQTLSVPIFAIFLFIGFGITAFAKVIPQEIGLRLALWLDEVGPEIIATIIFVVFVAVDALLLMLALKRFQRSRLSLD